MNLTTGLLRFQSSNSYENLTIPLEKEAQDILSLLLRYNRNPTPTALSKVRLFLIEVERWKADCLQERMGNAAKNLEAKIWNSFIEAANAESDIDTILSIMQLKGFGSSADKETGQRRAKLATSVLRFLWPEKWGVVDWRVVGILNLYKEYSSNIDRILIEAKKLKAEELRTLYNIIDENAACSINEDYRQICQKETSLPRAADVDMALFGLSLMAWPMRTSEQPVSF